MKSSAVDYANTEEEAILVDKFHTLYSIAKSAQDNTVEANPKNLQKWRKAYLGTLNALKADGSEESNRKSRPLRKMVYELIESKIDNSIPMPKIKPRYKTDLPLVSITENYLKFEVDGIFTKYLNDKSERATYVDGTSWYKVWWDSLDNTHERSGNVKIDLCRVDQIVPQPGVSDYRDLEYIFERKDLSLARIYDLYGRHITPLNDTNIVETISCYYLNDDRVVGLFMYAPHSMQVICNDEDWQIRKIRKCTLCGTINPQGDTCRVCGNKKFKYENAEKEILDKDIEEIYNPYEAGETTDPDKRDEYAKRVFATAGTEIPFYRLTQLPFVPRPAISSLDNIYGMSEVAVTLEAQDAINKLYSKALDKTLKSGTLVTKPEKAKISDKDDTFKILGVRTAEEAAMFQSKQIVADTSQDVAMASILYESGKASSGVTESFQGAKDSSAVSGKAKQYAAAMTAGRIESLRVMKTAAFAGLYELVLKYLLAFSDETRKFTKVLPDGSQQEECWNKYMFLDRDKYGNIYYRDDLKFDSDPAATLSQNRAQMWQETQDKFIQGAMGNVADPRTLKLFWNIMDSLQYPLAKTVLAGIAENEQHLPPEVEQAIMQNPEIMQTVGQMIQEGAEQRGGARPNSGPKASGITHAASVEKTNDRNRAKNRQVASSGQIGGANVKGGTQ